MDIRTQTNLLIHAKAYEAAEQKMPNLSGFATERKELRGKYCQLSNPLTKDQRHAVIQQLKMTGVDFLTIQEAEARLKEWGKKAQDGLITVAGTGSVEQFTEDFVEFYVKQNPTLATSEYATFQAVKDKTRKAFTRVFQKAERKAKENNTDPAKAIETTKAEIKALLTKNKFSEAFINRAVEEWAWKAEKKA